MNGSITFHTWESAHVPEILQEIYIHKIYNRFMLGKKDGIFFDIGFNIGLWSFYASRYAKQIYAFEPVPELAEIGTLNMKNNGITNVEVIQKAVSNEDGKTTFYLSSNETMSSLNKAINDTGKSLTVDCVSLSTFVKEKNINHIDFIKLDVEGSEDKILASDGFKDIVPKVDTVVFEWHSWTNASPMVIADGLKHLGFTVKKIAMPVGSASVFVAEK